MPPMKIQPINSPTYRDSSIQADTAKPVLKSRLKKFFDRPFPSVLRISSAASEKPNAFAGTGSEGTTAEFEPSSVCLANMVQNFIEDNNEKLSSTVANAKCGRNRCNCFNGNNNDSSDDEFDFSDSITTNSSFSDSSDTLKSLIPCASVVERNLLADTSKIVEKNKACKRKDDLRKIVTDQLLKIGYNASICKSKWEKNSSIPAGEYEYIDVIVEGERVLIDVDFRSEFEIARSTGSYKAVLQLLPSIFIGKSDRLLQIVSIVSEAARISLKKKGMHIAPWRKADYIKAKWLSPHIRTTDKTGELAGAESEVKEDLAETKGISDTEFGELDLIFGQKMSSSFDSSRNETKSSTLLSSPPLSEEEKLLKPGMMTWQPPALKPKSCDRGNKIVVTGLASLLREKP